jgi:hypothetical protein
VALNAHWTSGGLVLGAEVFSGGALLLGVIAVVAGLRHLTLSRPETRRPVIFIILLTLVVLGAHLYVINSPPIGTPGGPVTGSVGTTINDSYITVKSNLSGTSLQVNVTDTSQSAIGPISITFGGTTLSSSGFSRPPSYTDPLEPSSTLNLGYRDQAQGSWVVPSGSAGELSVSYQYLTCNHIPDLGDNRAVLGCVMDETYYVPSAVGGLSGGTYFPGLLQGAQCSTSFPNCNLEHPFLAKALMAAGVAVFGLSTFGWRIFMVLLGTLSIPLLFALAYLVSGNKKVAYFAGTLMALDTLFFVHSSAALIDVPAVFFSLIGFIFYFWRSKYGRLDHLMASGIFFGLSLLTKETAIFALAAVVVYEALFGEGGIKTGTLRILKIAIPAGLVFVVGLQIYNSLFTSGSFPYFYQQLSYILSYGSGLKGGGWTDVALHRYITPLDWLAFYSPVSYLVTSVQVTSGSTSYSYVAVGYYGIANVIIVWMVFLWVPLAIYRALRNRRWKVTPSGDDKFALFLVVWFLFSYVPYILLWLYGRVTYPFYMVPAIPALAGGASYFITREWFSYRLALVYVAAAFLLFFLYFPVKDFLPIFLRTALGR